VVSFGLLATVAVAGPADDDRKLDQHLRQRLSHSVDAAPLRVIVTVRPGAKQRGLLEALRAQGASITADFTIIDGLAGELSPAGVRWLAKHADVVSIGTDAPITVAGIAAPVSGTAANADYSVPSTIGLPEFDCQRTGPTLGIAVID